MPTAYLFDTNILLRLVYREHAEHAIVRAVVATLLKQGDSCNFAPQNLAEFWNASTRPSTARGGLGRSILETDRAARLIERLLYFLPDQPAVHEEWRKLVISRSVRGVEVYDAKLVAFMKVHGLTHILSLDKKDFTRYEGISVIHPKDILPLPSP